ncbi:MAG: BF2992 family fimbrillin-A clan protein [Bacteroides sp.]
MKTIQFLHCAFFLLWVAAVTGLSSCQEGTVIPDGSEEGKQVAVFPQLAGMYDVTAASSGAASRATTNDFLTHIINLQEGSTLRLLAKKKDEAAARTKDYVVRTSGGGSQSLFPCVIDETTGAITSESKEPLFLPPGDYTFSAISPAHKYGSSHSIGNAESVIASNNQWTQTQASSITIDNQKSSQIILLNPLMQLTARITFTLRKKPGSGISSLAVMQDGIEVDRVKEEPVTLENVGDSIPAQVCANNKRLFIKEKDVKTIRKTFDGKEEECLWGEACLLPIDNRSMPMAVILNLMVNGVPTQFTFSIVNRIFYGGYSYNYVVTVKMSDGITVANWQETSWTTTVHSN